MTCALWWNHCMVRENALFQCRNASNEHRVGNKELFFSSVVPDLALRLGPDSERSGKIVCKKYETLWLQKRGKSMEKTKRQTKPGNSDDTQISRPDLRFASRENSEPTQKGAGATPKKPTQNHGDCLRHDTDKTTVSPKYAQTN